MKLSLGLTIGSLVVLVLTTSLIASGTAGVYALLTKVVLEPNASAPERIQLWGAFTLAEGANTLTPQRGYMYFKLPADPKLREAALKEWTDFKTIAGTGQAVAFGRFGYIGAFADELISRPAGNPPYVLLEGAQVPGMWGAKNPVRAESVTPAAPDNYPVDMGLTKLSSTGNLAAVVKRLEEALK
jgi:hypothetical protein